MEDEKKRYSEPNQPKEISREVQGGRESKREVQRNGRSNKYLKTKYISIENEQENIPSPTMLPHYTIHHSLSPCPSKEYTGWPECRRIQL